MIPADALESLGTPHWNGVAVPMSIGRDDEKLVSLTEAAHSLAATVAEHAPQMSPEVSAVVEHLSLRRFDVAVVGEFNRGKSTLLNRLLGREILPSGVLPVTSIVTELSRADADDEHVLLVFHDGSEQRIGLTELEQYVTEQYNPGNHRQVEKAQVRIASELLQMGAVFVDTPGVGSIFRQSTEMAREAVLRADGAIMVLSADAPMTESERGLIHLLSKRSERTFFVLNRADHIGSDDEREEIEWFIGSVLREAFGEEQRLYCLSAATGEGFEEFADDVMGFLKSGLDAARVAIARKDLTSLADRITNECELEAAALELNAVQLEDRLSQFRRASDWQHDSFNDDRVLFRHACQQIEQDLRGRLFSAATVTAEACAELEKSVADDPKANLELAIDRAIEAQVRGHLEPLRRREELEIERAWKRAAERFERATQRRADKLSQLAGDLFDVQLRPIQVTQPSGMRARFFYSPPVRDAAPAGVLTKLLRPLMPERRSREQLLAEGYQRLRVEMSRHVSRLSDDLSSRIEDANQGLWEAMDEQVNEVANAMLRVIERAQAGKTMAVFDERAQRERAEELVKAAESVRESIREAVAS